MPKYESANATKRKGRYQARIKYYDKVLGKWREHTKTLPKEITSKKEAKRLAHEWMDEMNAVAGNAPNAVKDETVASVVENYLDTELQSGAIEKSSHRQEKTYLNKWITPYIGNESFYTLTRDSINGWLTQLYKAGKAPNSICCAFYCLKKVYNYYYEIGEITKNPFDGVKPPKKGAPRITYLTEEQMEEYLNAVYEDFTPKDRQYIAFLIVFYTGLRNAEICGLRWRNINLKDGTITVDTSIGVGEGGSYTKGPKSKSSARTFPMVPQLIEAFKLRYEATNPQSNWYVIGKGTKHLNPSSMSKDFRVWADRHELKDAYDNPITCHGMRHNFATFSVKSGIDIASVSKMLGHSSRAMTLDVYADASKDAMIVAKDKLGEAFKK